MRKYDIEIVYRDGTTFREIKKGARNGANVLKGAGADAVKCVIRAPRGNVLSVCVREGNIFYYKPQSTEN